MLALRSTAIAWLALCMPLSAFAETKISYNRQIKPILAGKCFACHGPDEKERKAELRLDRRDEAVASAITPGNAEASELVSRIVSEDADVVMPPPDAKKPVVTAEEASLIRKWIDQGAEYDAHWAYRKPARPKIPAVENKSWPMNPVDRFALAGLETAGLRPAEEADKRTLTRRLSFDLTGLPPDATLFGKPYEEQVEQLLKSPHFGERMAQYWLDVVRYADTGGYHSDNHRDVWAYRDYVIKAFNENKPFDQFTIEQLAGDLLSGAGEEQRIASSFNRLLQTTEEGGAQPKEYAAKYAADRVRNTSVIWLASTMGCCECHTHKYDPFTIKDFYSFAAFFADINEKPVGRQDQTKLPTPKQAAQLKAIDHKLAAAKAELADIESLDLVDEWIKWQWSTREKPPRGLAPPILAALKEDPARRTVKQEQLLDTEFRKQAPQLAAEREKVAQIEKARSELDARILSTLVSMSVEPRTTRILARGNWLDDTGDIVRPAIPEFLFTSAGSAVPSVANPPQLLTSARLTRLDLARWITHQDNPLTARVFVNRLWKLMYGRGLVRTAEDFGSQGELPSHPELLDWLATEFIDSGWDVKHMLKLMVLSRTYRQTSLTPHESLVKDPSNELFSRQNRFRLDAEMIRDNALSVSGLLVAKFGGPSVKPYQPAGYWQYLNFPKREWQNDQGDNQYRRGLYTYWQRTFLHPSLAAFDAPSREECTVDRPKSNTPQQALVLLNDPTYVEAARALAVLAMKNAQTPRERINFSFQRVLARQPRVEEAAELEFLYEKHRAEFAAERESMELFLAVGDFRAAEDADRVQLAAWTSVMRVILNLHETITRY